jgi:predicted MFS family arabinose efflux permease
MGSEETPVKLDAGRPERNATRLAFFITGFAMSSWAPLVPFAKARAAVDNGSLGILLLCLGVGSILTMPLAGALVSRFGCRRVVVVTTALLCLALPLLATLSNALLLGAALFAFGVGLGSIDVAMNIQAIIVERASGRAMMSGFHAFFSIGGLAGAACVTALLGCGATPLGATLCAVAVILMALAAATPGLRPYGGQRDGPVFAVPRGIVLFVGALCFIAFLAEGALLDWSAVFLTSVRGVAAEHAGLGYVLFSVTMTLGRLTGDRIVRRFGGDNVIILGGICSAFGFALATLAPSWPVALAGFAVIGIGCANIVPVLYTDIGRQTAVPEHVAVPAVTTLGYAGILIGPAAIGLVAREINLSAAFLILAALQLVIAASGRLPRT